MNRQIPLSSGRQNLRRINAFYAHIDGKHARQSSRLCALCVGPPVHPNTGPVEASAEHLARLS